MCMNSACMRKHERGVFGGLRLRASATGACVLAYPEGYGYEAPAKRGCSLELDPSPHAPHSLASRVSRMLEEDTSRLD